MIGALVTDLFFQIRIKTTAASCGREVRFVSSADQLLEEAGPTGLVIVDLDLESVDPVEAIRKVKGTHPALRVIAYGPHVRKERMVKAREQGADRVLPRSRFTVELAEILGGAPD